MLQLPLNVQLDDTAKFDNYFVAENQQVFKRLNQVSLTPSEFLFVWGGLQTGKTHLAQAVCHQSNINNLGAAYLPLENNELSPEILQGMSFMNVVCLDNLQSIIEEDAWQVALFNLYNELKNTGHSLVVFSDKPPAELSINLADLKSRLTAMEVYKLEELNDENKIALFKARADNRGINLSDEVVSFIFNRFGRSMSELIAILEKLDHSSIALKRKVTIPLVKQILD